MAGKSAAIDRRINVVISCDIGDPKRLSCKVSLDKRGEVVFNRSLVNCYYTGSGAKANTCDRLLATSC